MNPRLLPLVAFLTGCGDTEPVAPPAATDPCPEISMDGLEGRWIKYAGKADHTWRFEVVKDPAAPDKLEMWLTGGGWTKRRMTGERRTGDWMFTEVPTAQRQAAAEAGDQSLMRLYVEPHKKKCALRTSQVDVNIVEGVMKERPKPGFVEYVAFPETYKFSFQVCNDALFFGKAAKNKAAADGQLASLNGPDPSSSLGEALVLGAWTDAAADGDPTCTYDMDLYFDDQPAKNKDGQPVGPVPAQPAADGVRQWLVDGWYAPFSGNHHFQAFRYKTCGGGARTVIGVSCVEAVLQ